MKRTKTILCAAGLLCIGTLAGVWLGVSVNTKKTNGNAFAKDTKYILEFQTYHTLCRHTDIYQDKEAKSFSGTAELEALFPTWRVRTPVKDKITLYRQTDDYCEAHYFVHLKADSILIEHRNGNLKQTLNAKFLSLTDAEREQLETGVYLNGKEELTAFLEDFNS